jgi:cellulose synthase/poly-beta-1,6-N-acetylglucosamine synthase-like glycosyltransferase/phosphoglycerol transferase MdoB-like AlkP superfamily enzyme
MHAYDAQFGWSDAGLGVFARAGIIAIAGAQLLWPAGAAILVGLAIGSRRVSALPAVVTSGVCGWLALDLLIWRITGNSASAYIHMAFADGGLAMGGGAGLALPLGRQVLLGVVLGAITYSAVALAVRRLVARVNSLGRPLVATFTIAALPILLAPGLPLSWIDPIKAMQLSDAIAFPLVSSRNIPRSGSDGSAWKTLDRWLEFVGPQVAKRMEVGAKTVQPIALPPPRETATQAGEPRTNVLMIVVESLRADALTPDLMPRLSAWAERGLTLDRHYSSGNSSERGLYSLLYGLDSTTFGATVERGNASALAASLRHAGYRNSLFCGVSMKWNGMDRFLSPVNFDELDCEEHESVNEGDSWNEGDRRSLSLATDRLRQGGATFVVVHVNSTHFPYRYPQEYERRTPVASLDGVTWNAILKTSGSDDSFRTTWTNRYANSLGYIDTIVADALERIDPKNTLVVLAGDHGESFGDDGFWLHSGPLSDAQLHVSAVIVGPNVPRQRASSPTSHIDIVPSVLGALGASARGLRALPGIDVRSIPPNAPNTRPLLVTTQDARYIAVLASDERIMLDRTNGDAALRTVGLMDDRGQWTPRDRSPRASPKVWSDAMGLALLRSLEPSSNQAARADRPSWSLRPWQYALTFPVVVVLVLMGLRLGPYRSVVDPRRLVGRNLRPHAQRLALAAVLALAAITVPLLFGIRLHLVYTWLMAAQIGAIQWVGVSAFSIVLVCEAIITLHLLFYLKLCYDGTRPTRQDDAPPLNAGEEPAVVLLIPACDEQPSTLERPLGSLQRIRYPKCRVILVENSRDPEAKRAALSLAAEYGVEAFDLPNYGTKAAALNEARRRLGSGVTYVAVLDADQLIDGDFVSDLVPLLERDATLGWLQTPQSYETSDERLLQRAAAQQMSVLFDSSLEGKSARGLCPILGTGFIVRVAALDSVGGWRTDFINEDTATSYFMQLAAWKGRYIPRMYTSGIAPPTLGALAAQQVRWSHSNTLLVFEIVRGFFRRQERPSRVVADYLSFASFEIIMCLIALLSLTPTTFLVLSFFSGPALGSAPVDPLRWAFASLYSLYVLLVLFPQVNLALRGYPTRNLLLLQGLNACMAPSYARGVRHAIFGAGRLFETTARAASAAPRAGRRVPAGIVPQAIAFAVLVGLGSGAAYLIALQPQSPFPWVVLFWSAYHAISAGHIWLFNHDVTLSNAPERRRVPRRNAKVLAVERTL